MKTIVVHDGTFHAHDIFACAIASLQGYDVVRTRDKAVIAKAVADGALVYDVGLDLAPSTDHHNWKGYNGDLNSMYPMHLLKPEHATSDLLDILTDIATIDCGMDITPDGIPTWDYMNEIISSFNPTWREDDDHIDEYFQEALTFATGVIINPEPWVCMIMRKRICEDGVNEAQGLVTSAFFNAVTRDKKRYIILDPFCPWKEHIALINRIHDNPIHFVLFPERGHETRWRVQAVNVSPDSFELLTPIQATTDSKGCYFVHPNKFIAGFETKEDAIAWVESGSGLI